MKILPALLLSLVAGTALAHGNHDDDAPMIPLKPGARPAAAPATPAAPDTKAEADKLEKAKAERKRAAEKKAADAAASKP